MCLSALIINKKNLYLPVWLHSSCKYNLLSLHPSISYYSQTEILAILLKWEGFKRKNTNTQHLLSPCLVGGGDMLYAWRVRTLTPQVRMFLVHTRCVCLGFCPAANTETQTRHHTHTRTHIVLGSVWLWLFCFVISLLTTYSVHQECFNTNIILY